MSLLGYYSDQIALPKTDPKRWRLRTTELGNERWEYIAKEEIENDPQSNYVKYLLKIHDEFPSIVYDDSKPLNRPFECAIRGANFLKFLQEPCGIFPCQYKGPMFMTIGYVAACKFCDIPIEESVKIELIRYIVNSAHPVDGGWGLHEVDKSTCFGTTMNYLNLRLLGLPANHPVCVKARKTLLRLGGALANPHWGKAWLSVLNLYKWEGVNPAPPELWMLPYAFPAHPARWWVHTRAIYLPLGYLSSKKISCKLDPLLEQLRAEIYTCPFQDINFNENRNNVCGIDLYYPHTSILNFLNNGLVFYEKYLRPNWLLEKSTKYSYELIKKENENTKHLGIAPVSDAFNVIVTFIEEGKDSKNFLKLVDRFKEVLFQGPQGMVVMGTNGVQVWDVSFCLQYFFMTGLADLPEYHDLILKGYIFLIKSQFTDNCVEGSYRDERKGAWPFSTKDQGYTVSDCTAEALKAIIMVKNHPSFAQVKDLIQDENLYDGIDRLLSLQNLGSFHFGSFSTYEKIRGTPLLELINPAEVFGNIMVEFPYVECTDSSVLGLTYFRKNFDYRAQEIDLAISRAIDYIIQAQQPDGSWYGCWGICFTYAGMFALEALSSVEKTYENDFTVKKGCDFLVARQMADGGWGECMKSSETHTYIDSGKSSLVVQTAWVLIGLLLANYPNQKVIEKGISLLMKRQKANGEWEFESIEGVFNHSCAIEYPSYKFLFPIKALGLFKNQYGDIEVKY
ncbi:hypothetical protein PACTADRAFT_47766 [Pachysolen tannophilus NRRL Y-2460]|uniref:Terpene cyclase/mutase family member n=1 Tax=Pachysolen tannophilus NRRL Y-2460 TaxID=669874 RepID=A0A1E4U1Q5_PACTA|nr:hypothetical protein PACTADRAFT_47766 [Pachysolen tannophilus NRRL Y-2460]